MDCTIGVAMGGQRGHAPKFVENIVILCFEIRFSKQNTIIRLKSNILAPAKFWGWLRHWTARPDGYGRWDSRIAAQHLPQGLVRPSSGLKNWLKRRSAIHVSALWTLINNFCSCEKQTIYGNSNWRKMCTCKTNTSKSFFAATWAHFCIAFFLVL